MYLLVAEGIAEMGESFAPEKVLCATQDKQRSDGKSLKGW